MMLTEITTGNSGNGSSDILKVLITRRRLSFQSLCAYQCFFGVGDGASSISVIRIKKL
jgi:hypothetical protein